MNTKAEQTNFSHGDQKKLDWGIQLIEKGLVPDFLIRKGIRSLLKQRLNEEHSNDPEKSSDLFDQFLNELKASELAIHTDAANEQHYEVDAKFFELSLGKRKKYSSCYYDGNETLDEAEIKMLDLYLERGQFKDGQEILELGCGWGSLTLYMAEKLPHSKITAISNSHSQREFIMSQAKKKNLNNINIITKDINKFDIETKFDRIVSIEMFEHIRNYKGLFKKISGWLKDDGKLFVHIFCHRFLMYPFNTEAVSYTHLTLPTTPYV